MRTATAQCFGLPSTISYLAIVSLAPVFFGNGMPALSQAELKRRRRAAARSLLSGSREAAGFRPRWKARSGPAAGEGFGSATHCTVGLQTRQLGQGGIATGSGDRGQRGAWQFTNGSLQTARGSLQTWQFTNVPVCKRGSLQTWQFTNGAWQFTNVAVYKRRVAVYKRRVAVYKRGSLQTWQFTNGAWQWSTPQKSSGPGAQLAQPLF